VRGSSIVNINNYKKFSTLKFDKNLENGVFQVFLDIIGEKDLYGAISKVMTREKLKIYKNDRMKLQHVGKISKN